MTRRLRATFRCLGLLALGLAWQPGPAVAQTPRDAELAIPDVPPGIRGIRLPETAAPASDPKPPVATRAVARPDRPAGQDSSLSEPTARCLLRHIPKAAGNAEIFRDIRRICAAYPGVE